MDLDLALWQLDPNAVYRLDTTKQVILEWRGPGPQPTPKQLQDAWTAYQAAQTQQVQVQTQEHQQRQAFLHTILTRPLIAGDPALQAALSALLTQLT